MPITHSDISADEDLGRRVLVRARIIAPCIDSFESGSEEEKDAVAILKGVVADLPGAGEGRIRSMSRNGTSITMERIARAFDGDPSDSLRSLCGAASTRAGLPVGSFPADSSIGRVWPEGRYS